MEVSSGLTNEEIEAALQLIQLISSSSDSRRDTTVNNNGKPTRTLELSKNSNTHGGASYGTEFKQEGDQSEEDAASAAYVSSSFSPASVEKILRRKSRSSGERKRKLLVSRTRAQIRKETNAADQKLVQISEEEGGGGGGGESSCNISGTSYITDASSGDAVEKRRDDRERASSGARGGRGNRGASGFSRGVEEEDSMEERCLADIFCRRRKRKFRCLIDIYTATDRPLNAPVDF